MHALTGTPTPPVRPSILNLSLFSRSFCISSMISRGRDGGKGRSDLFGASALSSLLIFRSSSSIRLGPPRGGGSRRSSSSISARTSSRRSASIGRGPRLRGAAGSKISLLDNPILTPGMPSRASISSMSRVLDFLKTASKLKGVMGPRAVESIWQYETRSCRITDPP